MNRLPISCRFRHVVFPGQLARRHPLPLARLEQPSPARRPEEAPISAEGVAFLGWLFAKAGLDARMYRLETLQRRLPACLRVIRAPSVTHARRMLDESPSLVTAALSSLLVGVTSFFRDAAVFAALKDQVLPALRRWRRAIHIWSAGCSEGAELYSIAILLAEEDLLEKSYLLGTDCRADAVESAERGVFDANAVKDVTPGMLERYFKRSGATFEVCRGLRSGTRWRVANVLSRPEPGYWDMILFRNTAIYLRSESVASLFEKMDLSLKPGGVLVLGKSERPVGAKRLTFLSPCVYRRVR